MRLSPQDFARVVTWIDLNVPYYGSYFAVYAANRFGRSPLTTAQYGRLRELGPSSAGRNPAQPLWRELELVNFTRPRQSPILQQFARENDPRYIEALAIIQSGKEQLARQPREDMLGAKAGPILPEDLNRMARLHAYRKQIKPVEK